MSGLVFIGSLLMTPVGPGNPFMAHYERVVLPKGSGSAEKVERGTILVDREGRARTGIDAGVDEIEVAAIWDPVEQAAWMVENGSNLILMDIPWPEPGRDAKAGLAAPPTEGSAAGAMTSSRPEPLGNRTIEGLDCEGARIQIDGVQGRLVVERWFSRDLGHVVLETTDSSRERVTFRMSDIKRVDPDAELFRPKPRVETHRWASRLADSLRRQVGRLLR